MMRRVAVVVLALCALALVAGSGQAADGDPAGLTKDSIDTVWTLLAAFLVFFMQAGFAMVETGFTRAKNACNILMKNMMDFSIGSLAYWAVGFGIMFGETRAGLFGTDGLFLSGGDPATSDGLWQFAYWMFQAVFAATAATVVSGAMAERTKFTVYLVCSGVITALV